jgi:tetratricopeptide (TPR) repeat protein
MAARISGAIAQDLETRAAAARDADDIPTALELYRQAVEEKPGWLEGWWFLGFLNYESHRFAGARQAFAEFTRLNPRAPAGWAFLGLCEYETGEYNGALQHLERGFAAGGRLDPEVEQVARFHRALLLTRDGDFDRARAELETFVVRGIHDPVLIAGLGLNALDISMAPQEVPAVQRDLVEMAGKTAYAWVKGDTGETEAAFRALLSAYPGAPGVHYLYATYLLTARPEAMNGELERELEVNPDNARARAALALRLAKAGDAAAALPLARRAVADSPGLALAQDAYGVVLTETGAFSDAIDHLQKAVRIAPDNLGYHAALATAYSEAGRYEEARNERRASILLAKESRGPG